VKIDCKNAVEDEDTTFSIFVNQEIDLTSIHDTVFSENYSPQLRTDFLNRLVNSFDNKSFLEVKDFLQMLETNNNDSIKYNFRYTRDRTIVKEYNEVKIQVSLQRKTEESTLLDSISTSTMFSYPFEIRMIEHKKNIVSYNIYETVNQRIGGQWTSRDLLVRVENNLDSIGVKLLNERYIESFDAKIDITQLFRSDIVYGSHCGFTGTNPQFRDKLISAVERKDTTELVSWLHSSSVEIQLYAIEGIYTLSEKGTDFNTKIFTQIDLVEKKQGTASTCSGCSFWDTKITEIVHNIKKSITRPKANTGLGNAESM